MYPTLFTVPGLGLEVSTFGVMLAVAFLVGGWIADYRMREAGVPGDAWNLLIYVMVGGIVGGKLYFAIDVSLREGQPFAALLFSRGGITWYGGLIGGALGALLGCRVHRVPLQAFVDASTVSAAVGQALGRVGCFLVGDDWGRPTDRPWGIAFPRGIEPTHVPVHPTQLYEVAWLAPVALLLWWRRERSPFLFGEYLALAGSGRFVIEFWRTNQPVLFGLTEAQCIGAALMLTGVASTLWIARSRSTPEPAR